MSYPFCVKRSWSTGPGQVRTFLSRDFRSHLSSSRPHFDLSKRPKEPSPKKRKSKVRYTIVRSLQNLQRNMPKMLTTEMMTVTTANKMMKCDETWWTMMKHDELWWNMMKYDDVWWHMIHIMNYDDIWRRMMTYDETWRNMMKYDKIYE